MTGGIQRDGIEDISQSSLKFLLKLFVKHFAVRRGEADPINRDEKNAISTFANDDENSDNFIRNENILDDNVVYEIRNAKTSINLL